MGSLRRLAEITPGERRLLVKAWFLLWTVRLCLWLLPFATSRRFVAWAGRTRPGSRSEPGSAERLAWAVRVAGRFVPGGSHCLTRAMTAQILLTRQGYPAHLRFGVLEDGKSGFTAHAWTKSDGKAVVGGSDLDRYVELSSPTDSPS